MISDSFAFSTSTQCSNVQKEAYGVANMEDRLKRNAHFRYRGNLDESNTFQK